MSEQCHVCGPVKHEAPILFCGPCAFLHELGWDPDEICRNAGAKIVLVKRDDSEVARQLTEFIFR